MALTHEVCHKQVIKVLLRPMLEFSLNWEPTDTDMVTVWKSGEDAACSDWSIEDKFITFKNLIKKGTIITVREYRVVKRKKGQRK